MPTFHEVFDDLLTALGLRAGGAVEREGSGVAPEGFPAVLATLLTQLIDAHKAAQGVEALRDAGLIAPEALAQADPSEIRDALAEARVKPPTRALGVLIRVAGWYAAHADRLDRMATEALREELRTIHGVGPGTADALLLHALNRPVYPLDRAGYRVLVRHGWIDPFAEYDEARDVLEGPAQGEVHVLRILNAGLTRIGADFCRASKPRCDRCPLRPFLPPDGPILPDEDEM